MTVMTKKQVRVLDQLMSVAGSAEIVERALRELNTEGDGATDIKRVVRRIIEIQNQSGSELHAASH